MCYICSDLSLVCITYLRSFHCLYLCFTGVWSSHFSQTASKTSNAIRNERSYADLRDNSQRQLKFSTFNWHVSVLVLNTFRCSVLVLKRWAQFRSHNITKSKILELKWAKQWLLVIKLITYKHAQNMQFLFFSFCTASVDITTLLCNHTASDRKQKQAGNY